MQKTITPRRHKLRSWEEVTTNFRSKSGSKPRSVIKESHDQSVLQADERADLKHFIMSVPRNLTYEEKMRRLAFLADKITDVEESDVVCLATWIPSGSH